MKSLAYPIAWILATGIPALAAPPEKNDPFESALLESIKEYRSGHIGPAKEALTKAQAILDKQKSAKAAAAFPKAPEGWTAGEITNHDVPAAFGGGRVIQKKYSAKDSRRDVLVEVLYDASSAKLLMGLAANDAIAEAQGYKLRRVNGQRVLIKKTDGNVEMTMPIDDSILVKLSATGGASEDDAEKILRETDRRLLADMK